MKTLILIALLSLRQKQVCFTNFLPSNLSCLSRLFNFSSIFVFSGMKGLKMGPVGKNDSDGTDADEAKMASNVICKCEKVTGTVFPPKILASMIDVSHI